MQWLRSKPCYILGKTTGVEVAHIFLTRAQGSNFQPISERTFDLVKRSHKGRAAFFAIPLHKNLHRLDEDCIHSGREIDFFERHNLSIDKVYAAVCDYMAAYILENSTL